MRRKNLGGGGLSLSVLKDVINTLQIFVGILDASDSAGPLEGVYESRLLNQIVHLNPAEQTEIISVLVQLLVRRSRFENRAVEDQALDALSVHAANRPTT